MFLFADYTLILRIPEGRYEAQWHNYGIRINTLQIHNRFVSLGRSILIHNGNTPKDSEGCMLINDCFMDNMDNIIFQNKQENKTKEQRLAKILTKDFTKEILGKSINNINDFIKEYIEVRIRNNFTLTHCANIENNITKINNKEGIHLFSIERKDIKKCKLSTRELYAIKGIQWFEASADNYHKLLYVNEKLKDRKECQKLGVLYFTWKEVVEFAESMSPNINYTDNKKDEKFINYAILYARKNKGDWKEVDDGAKGYLLVSMEGIPYWADAVGQIPYAINIYKGFLHLKQNKVKAKNATINVGYAFSEGKIGQIWTFYNNFIDNLCFKDDIYDETLNPPTDKNSYDNKMILRGINYGINPYIDLALDSKGIKLYE